MRKATKTTLTIIGIMAGISGAFHGVTEFLQGAGGPHDSIMFASMGAPCQFDVSWCACEPAMSIFHNFRVMGIITMALGALLSLWFAFQLQRRLGGWVAVLLSVALLLAGGGFFPPVIGITAGLLANSLHKPLPDSPKNGWNRFLSKLWPWPLGVFPAPNQIVAPHGALFNQN